jgi:hypothetical protein
MDESSVIDLLEIPTREEEERCPVTNTDARNVTRNSLSLLALESTMLGRRNARNAVGKNWNNSLPLSRRKPPERVSELESKVQMPKFKCQGGEGCLQKRC